ncbi:caspase family protein [Streptomyces sp. NPDC058746]|uniref:caspase, EACC1-associated type n=1 Tax=Streptomyces sp. NPDC058746 TaxID=3346622 RepID=UPI0036B912B1
MIAVWKEWAGEKLNESEWLSLLDLAQRESAEEDALVRGDLPVPPPPVSGHPRVTPPPPAPRHKVPDTPPPRPSTELDDRFGPWLARQLRRSGLTQSDLAMELGLTRAAVSAWVTGRAEPRSEVRRQVAKVLKGVQQFAPLERWKTGAAVLIGVSEYTHLPSVPSIKNNLSALTEVALTGLGIPHSNVHTVENPTSAAQVHEKIDLAMEAADPVSGGLFIYYAGHGWTDPRNGRLLLGLVESNQHKTWTAMEFDRLREQIADSPVGSRLLVLDSCYSGAALDTLSAGLSSASRIEGTYVMTSSNATNASRAPQGDHFTTFSGEIIRSLTDGIQGGPRVIDTDTLFRHVRASCEEQGWPVPSRQIGRDGDRVELMSNRWGQP